MMKLLLHLSLLCSIVITMSACANPPPQKPAPHKKLKLETIDHGPMRPKTYLYRQVD